jgi:hypothetical protein
MNQHVWLHMWALSKSFPTNFAYIWFLSCMDPQVFLKVTFLWACFTANRTFERTFSHMRFHMDLQISWGCRCESTQWTVSLICSSQACRLCYTHRSPHELQEQKEFSLIK